MGRTVSRLLFTVPMAAVVLQAAPAGAQATTPPDTPPMPTTQSGAVADPRNAAVTSQGSPPTPAANQGTTGPDVGDIVVTAQRRSERLLNVPLAITAIGASELAARGITGLSALTNGAVPSLVAFPVAGNPNVLGLSIRGVTVADPSQGTADPGVAVYLDGVFLGRAQGLGLDLVDPERIEVLRGPQGTLFGRNAEGGAIQIVTRPPSGKFEGSVIGSVGDYGLRKGVMHVNLPEVANFSVKIDALHAYHGGWVDNGPRNTTLTSQQDFGISKSTGVRAAVRWQPSTDFTADYAYDYSIVDYTPDYWLRTFGAVAPPPAGNPRPIDTGRPKRSWIGLWNEYNRTRTQGHALTLAYSVSPALQIKSITAYREVNDRQDIPTDNSITNNGVVSSARIAQNQFSQEFQLTGSVPRLNYTGGVLYFRENITDQRFSSLGVLSGVAVNPILLSVTNNIQSARATSYGVYGQVGYTPPILDDKLEITAGLRYGRDRKTAQRTVSANVTLPTPQQAQPFIYNPLNPAISVKYSFTPDVNIFVRWAEGYRSGGVNVRSVTFSSFNQEVARSWEAGLKGLFLKRRLSLSLVGFDNHITDLQATVIPNLAIPTISDTINLPGKYRARGVEFESRLSPVDGLTLSANYTYTTERRPALNGGVGPQLLGPTVPKHAGSASIEYAAETGFATIVPRVDYYVTSGYQRPGLNAGIVPADSRADDLNARVTLRNIRGLPEGLSASFWMKNVLNSTVIQWAAPSGGSILSNPRRFGFDLGLRF